MDFEYRIFKFVPQVDRFVNEQMQFKLQECSYNKASTFEIDDDYADDYDFGLYQGDRSKQIILYINYVKIKSILLMKKSI